MSRIPRKQDRIAIVYDAIVTLNNAVQILEVHRNDPDKGARGIEEAVKLIDAALGPDVCKVKNAGLNRLLEHYFS